MLIIKRLTKNKKRLYYYVMHNTIIYLNLLYNLKPITMKTIQRTLLALMVVLVCSSGAMSKTVKAISSENKDQVHIDLVQFSKYLKDGNPHQLEGVYSSDDGRYIIALIKNTEKSHDFIGVVISADNSYWTEGEVKFNFVMNSNGKLEGYYYNSNGEAFPMSFTIDNDTLSSKLLHKLDIEQFRYGGIANL